MSPDSFRCVGYPALQQGNEEALCRQVREQFKKNMVEVDDDKVSWARVPRLLPRDPRTAAAPH